MVNIDQQYLFLKGIQTKALREVKITPKSKFDPCLLSGSALKVLALEDFCWKLPQKNTTETYKKNVDSFFFSWCVSGRFRALLHFLYAGDEILSVLTEGPPQWVNIWSEPVARMTLYVLVRVVSFSCDLFIV